MNKLLDLYTDYLQISLGLATATGLSNLVDNQVSHDQVTRMLSHSDYNSKTLWHEVKPLVRQHETEEACLIFDDSILHKPHTDENDVVCWHYDHTQGRNVKGINLLTAFYHTQFQDTPLRVPIGFEIISKPKIYNPKTQKEQRKSPATKNELMRNMIIQAIKNTVKFRYILADTWFSSSENMKFIHEKKKLFIFDLKYNRLAIVGDRNKGNWQRIEQLILQPYTPTKVWLKDVEIELLLIKQVFTNKDGSTGVRYLVSNDLSLTSNDFKNIYQKRWSVEEYHKSLKQNSCITKSPTRTIKTQCNHVVASILSYTKFERYKFSTNLNHFALRTKLFAKAAKIAFAELTQIKLQHANFQNLFTAA
jgi:hypothetical protein